MGDAYNNTFIVLGWYADLDEAGWKSDGEGIPAEG